MFLNCVVRYFSKYIGFTISYFKAVCNCIFANVLAECFCKSFERRYSLVMVAPYCNSKFSVRKTSCCFSGISCTSLAAGSAHKSILGPYNLVTNR